MKPIKAIVLTYDKYRSFTDHMIYRYGKLWPDHPFEFQVPYQQLPPTFKSNNVRYHQTPPDIKGTVLTLLDALDDEEMVYWCIDDKYPIKLDIRKIKKIHQWLSSGENQDISGLLFCRCRGMLLDQNFTGERITDKRRSVYLERANYEQIWIHQYLKVKVIRHLFDSFPDEIASAKMMDGLKWHVKKPESHQLYVTADSLASFGESTSRGMITVNCLKSMKAGNIPIPSWATETTPYEIIMDGRPRLNFGRIVNALTRRLS
jgi:hypothetical protein